MELREREKKVLIQDKLAQFRGLISRGPAWTLLKDSHPIASGGLVRYWANVYEAWLVFSRNAFDSLSTTKQIIKSIRFALNSTSWDRIQAVCPADDGQSIRFAEKFGFKVEGKLYRYMPDGTDGVLVAKVRC